MGGLVALKNHLCNNLSATVCTVQSCSKLGFTWQYIMAHLLFHTYFT